MTRTLTATLVAALVTAAPLAALAGPQSMGSPATDVPTTMTASPAPAMGKMGGDKMGGAKMKMGGARFGGTVASEAPDLQATLALVIAGGGPAHFKTTTLFGVLAGPAAKPELAKLTKEYGSAGVGQFIKTFDFVIADSLRLVKANHIALPSTPKPSPKDGKALAAALYTLGVDASTGNYNVEYMLDRLVSHPIHVQVMKDIDARYGVKADASYHVVLLEIMRDLKAAYGL